MFLPAAPISHSRLWKAQVHHLARHHRVIVGHFEQNHHVAHRLARHGAGRRMDFDRDGPSELAAAIAEEIGREPRYLPVDPNGAARAAQAIAELLV